MNRHYARQLSNRLKHLKETGIFEYTQPKFVCIFRPQPAHKLRLIHNFSNYVDAEFYIDDNIFKVMGESLEMFGMLLIQKL